MNLRMVGIIINWKPRPSSTTVRLFLRVRSLQMLHTLLVVDWILSSKSTFFDFNDCEKKKKKIYLLSDVSFQIGFEN